MKRVRFDMLRLTPCALEFWRVSLTPMPEGITPWKNADGIVAARKNKKTGKSAWLQWPVPGRRTWTDAERDAYYATAGRDSARIVWRLPANQAQRFAELAARAAEEDAR